MPGGITLGPGGVLAPGESIGKITANGALQFGSGSIFGLEIDPGNGTADQVSAVNVSIGLGVTLRGQLIGAGLGLFGQEYTIIDNRSFDPIVGIFCHQPEGSKLRLGDARFLLSYVGGDGNDVTLTSTVPEPATLWISLAASSVVLLRRRPKVSGTQVWLGNVR